MASLRKKIVFKNQQGLDLAGLMELPSSEPKGMVLFAHCFTCGKDVTSASRISRALALQGFGVLRFDFTGLGSSDGDFANTNFSSNVGDLLAAVDFLSKEYRAPEVLIGHSLGGAAVLSVASDVPSCKAVVTIGAPASPDHVMHHFQDQLEQIEKDGQAEVSLGGRPFHIQHQFVEDLRAQNQQQRVRNLGKALLIFHSPIDSTVSVNEAASIYEWAMHPKSFVSLDNADHLLTKAKDAEYVAETVVAWVRRYLIEDSETADAGDKINSGNVLVAEKNQRFTRNVITDDHHWLADEPAKVGGDNFGPDPYELLLASLGACTSMTMRMYANRKKWPVEDIYVSLRHERKHSDDCEGCSEAEKRESRMDVLYRDVRIEGASLTDEQRDRLLEIADKCPVHKTLENNPVIHTALDQS